MWEARRQLSPLYKAVIHDNVAAVKEHSANITLLSAHDPLGFTALELALLLKRTRLWVQMPSAERQGSPVTVIQDLGGGQEIERPGQVLRLLDSLDPNGRMVRLLVTTKDPLGLNSADFNTVPLLIGTYVGVEIEGPILSQVFTLPRPALRENDSVWVVGNDNTLEIRDVTIASRTKENVIVTEGINPGDKIVTSAISVPVPGMELRTISAVTPSRD